jgi:hypothetical protein
MGCAVDLYALGWTGHAALDESALREDQSVLPRDQSNMAAAAAVEDVGADPHSERRLPVALSPPPAPAVSLRRAKGQEDVVDRGRDGKNAAAGNWVPRKNSAGGGWIRRDERAAEQEIKSQVHANALQTIAVVSRSQSDPICRPVLSATGEGAMAVAVATAVALAPNDNPQVNAVNKLRGSKGETVVGPGYRAEQADAEHAGASSAESENFEQLQTTLTQSLTRTEVKPKRRFPSKSPPFETAFPFTHHDNAQCERMMRQETRWGVSNPKELKRGQRGTVQEREKRLEKLATPGPRSKNQYVNDARSMWYSYILCLTHCV